MNNYKQNYWNFIDRIFKNSAKSVFVDIPDTADYIIDANMTDDEQEDHDDTSQEED